MARITSRQQLDHAAEHDYGVPAFNINNMEQALAIMEAASAVDAPVIIQASRGARAYANDIMLKHMMDAVTEIHPQIPVCVHLDHGNGPDTCMTAIQRFYLGDDRRLAETGRQDRREPGLQCRRHPKSGGDGASRRHFGGGRTRRAGFAGGVPVSEIQHRIRNGVRKINIDTDNRIAMTGQIRKVLSGDPGEFDPRKYLKPAMEAMARLCKQRCRNSTPRARPARSKRC